MDIQPEKEGKTSFLKRINFTRSCSQYKLPTIKNWIITLIGFTLFTLIINGFLENIGQFIGIEKIYAESMLFLRESLVTSLEHFATLSVIKGLTAAISNTSPLYIAIGKIISPIAETINFLWRIFGFSMISITCQMAILNFSTVVSKYIFITGTLSLLFNFVDTFKKIGGALMLIAVILYLAMPCSIYSGKLMFESNSKIVNSRLTKDLEQFKNQIDNVKIFSLSNLKLFSKPKETVNSIGGSLSEKLDALIHSFIRYFSNLLIMFVITPLFFYSIMYLLIKGILCTIGMGKTSVIVDAGIIKALKRSKA